MQADGSDGNYVLGQQVSYKSKTFQGALCVLIISLFLCIVAGVCGRMQLFWSGSLTHNAREMQGLCSSLGDLARVFLINPELSSS